MLFPSADIATELPKKSSISLPTIALPICCTILSIMEYVLIWPLLESNPCAEHTNRVPSADISTAQPNWLSWEFPVIVLPIGVWY